VNLPEVNVRIPFELQVGLRYLRAKRQQTFISLISVISVAGVALGVMAADAKGPVAEWAFTEGSGDVLKCTLPGAAWGAISTAWECLKW